MSHAATAVASRETHPCYFLLRRLHSLTGILFGLYICVHLLINATLIQGPGTKHSDAMPEATASMKLAAVKESAGVSIFQQQVDKIHSLPFLLGIELAFIFSPLIIHTVYGIYVMTNGKPNVGAYTYVKNWFYVLQRVSAIALVLFIVFHVGAMFGWFGPGLAFRPHGEAFESTVQHLQSSWILSLVVYPLGVLAGTYHLANGFWTAGITWGLTVSKQAQMRWGLVCLGLFFFTTACGFISIVATFVYRNQVM